MHRNCSSCCILLVPEQVLSLYNSTDLNCAHLQSPAQSKFAGLAVCRQGSTPCRLCAHSSPCAADTLRSCTTRQEAMCLQNSTCSALLRQTKFCGLLTEQTKGVSLVHPKLDCSAHTCICSNMYGVRQASDYAVVIVTSSPHIVQHKNSSLNSLHMHMAPCNTILFSTCRRNDQCA